MRALRAARRGHWSAWTARRAHQAARTHAIGPDHGVARWALAPLLHRAFGGGLLLLLRVGILRGVLRARFAAKRKRARDDEHSSRNRSRALPESSIGRRHGVPVAIICGSNCGDF